MGQARTDDTNYYALVPKVLKRLKEKVKAGASIASETVGVLTIHYHKEPIDIDGLVKEICR